MMVGCHTINSYKPFTGNGFSIMQSVWMNYSERKVGLRTNKRECSFTLSKDQPPAGNRTAEFVRPFLTLLLFEMIRLFVNKQLLTIKMKLYETQQHLRRHYSSFSNDVFTGF